MRDPVCQVDVVVIGLGGVGSFALRALAIHHSNLRVLGLERFTRAHANGSSHGGSRIYRHAYFEHADYVPLIQYSTNEFQKLQEASGTKLLERCGTLVVEQENGPVISACKYSAEKHGIPVEHISNSALKERYPQFRLDNDMVGLLEGSSGFVRPERAIIAALEDAEDRGATIWENTSVQSFREVNVGNGSGHVEVAVKRESQEEVVVRAESLIIAAGAWTAKLVPSWAPYLTVTRQVQAWIDVTADPRMYQPKNMPTWLMSSPKLSTSLYGIPVDPESDNPGWIKVALHGRDVPVDPDDSRRNVTEAEMKELQEATHLFVNNGNVLPWPCAKSCLYTMTPDEHFLVGRPSGYQRTFAATGLSGHGFKMTPALGKALADLSVTATSSFQLDFLSPSRFGI